MSKRLKGTLLGILPSFAGVGLWIVFGAFLEIIAGWAGAIIGVLFLLVYRKVNPDDKSKYPYIIGIVLIIALVFLSEILTIAILSSRYDLDFSVVMSADEIRSAMAIDLIIGYVLSFAVFIGYIVSARRKSNLTDTRKVFTETENAAQTEAENVPNTETAAVTAPDNNPEPAISPDEKTKDN